MQELSWKVFVALKVEIVLNIIFFQKSLETLIYVIPIQILKMCHSDSIQLQACF